MTDDSFSGESRDDSLLHQIRLLERELSAAHQAIDEGIRLVECERRAGALMRERIEELEMALALLGKGQWT